jgi:peroxiredoxin
MMSAFVDNFAREWTMSLPRAARRAALPIALAMNLSCSNSNNGPAGPTNPFGIVLENIGLGVVSSPSQNTSYPTGTVVNYAFTASDATSRVYVTIDGVVAASSGTVTIDKSHTFNAFVDNQVGRPVPNFTARTSAGATVRMTDYLGKITLVDFSEPTCVGSPPEANALKAHYATYQPRGLEILTVLVSCPGLSNCPLNSPSPAATLDSWKSTYGLPYPVVSDVSGVTRIFNWSIPEKTTDFPVTYIVDAGGTIRYRFRGFDAAGISAALSALFP